MSDASDKLAAVRALVTASTQQLLGDTIGVDDEAWRSPSRLPGWGRGHVATHLARQADGLGRLVDWARTCGFEIVAAERQEQVAQRVHRRSAPETGTEDGVQALALEGDEGDDLLVGGRARKRGEDREQQQVAHAVALALGTARVGHLSECGKQDSEWHRATSRS